MSAETRDGMAEFSEVINQLVQVYEHDVGALRRELDQCHRATATERPHCSSNRSQGRPGALGPRPRRPDAPLRPQALVEQQSEQPWIEEGHPEALGPRPRRPDAPLRPQALVEQQSEQPWIEEARVGDPELDTRAEQCSEPPWFEEAGTCRETISRVSSGPGTKAAAVQEVISGFKDLNLKVSGRSDAPRKSPSGISSSSNASSSPMARARVGNLQIRREEVSLSERLVAGPLEQATGVVITLNVILTLVQLQVQGEKLAASFGSPVEPAAEGDLDSAEQVFLALQHVFNALFILELIARISFTQRKFLRSTHGKIQWFNLFDALIVTACSLDLYLTPLMGSAQSGSSNWTFARMLRLVRLSRTLKVVQLMHAFEKLRILMKTVMHSIMSFVWSMVILLIFNVGSAIFLCQMLQSTIADEGLDDELRVWLFKMYGTSGNALWTMFEFTFSGGWPTYARPVVEGVHWSYALFFALYVSIVVFAIIRIITALFLKDTLNIAAKDAELAVQESMKAKREFAHKLKELFEVVDTSGNGTIEFEEFCEICEIPEMFHYFKILELEISEVRDLFRILDDGDGRITYDEFERGITRVKGTARSIDVICVIHECERINERCQRLEDALATLISTMQLGAGPPVAFHA